MIPLVHIDSFGWPDGGLMLLLSCTCGLVLLVIVPTLLLTLVDNLISRIYPD
uniref:Uncharacterized protein n=1 Tax=Arundo donax TaxID=35708 RepID=A0A0A9FS29_ARUDO